LSDCELHFSEENKRYRDIISLLKLVPQRIFISFVKQRKE
jgi:hypothetical protein